MWFKIIPNLEILRRLVVEISALVFDAYQGITLKPRLHDDVIKWTHFPRHWPFVGGIHRSPVNSPHKGQWRGALMFTLICVRINGWVNNREAGDLRRYRGHYDATVMHQHHVGGVILIYIYLLLMSFASNMLCKSIPLASMYSNS